MTEVHGARQVKGAKILLIISSLACLVFLALAAWDDNFGGDWRQHQQAYKDQLAPELRAGFQIGHKQNYLPELARVDRCVTCHVAVEDPKMVSAGQPLTTHPGDFLKNHPPEKFGCTVCHAGQGLAVEKLAAHGRVPHWEEPMLEGKGVYTSCNRCHSQNDLYGAQAGFYGKPPGTMEIFQDELRDRLKGAERIARGKQLVAEAGCLGCHPYQGKGGSLGPDITYIGDKTIHSYDYSRLGPDEPHEPRQWLLRHFMNPEEISPGTVMPDIGLSREDAEALTEYMLSLKRRTLPAAYIPAPKVPKGEPLTGKQLYGLYCGSCHGAEGRSGGVPEIFTPKLNSLDALAVAGDEYYRYIIAHGRSDSKMQRWDDLGGNLTAAQIGRVVDYIRSWEPAGPDPEVVVTREGDVRVGKAIYRGRCANCHGMKGEGDLGPSLSAKNFLSMASDHFLRDSIVHGRLGTAMPSWKDLTAQDVADLIAFIRAWQQPKRPYTFEDLATLLPKPNRKPPRSSVRIGKKLFVGNCSGCHGRKGEGNAIGPALNNQDFLALVDARFLFTAIVDGRPGTAMPAWRQLAKEDVADLIIYMKSWQKIPDKKIASRPSGGDAEYGGILYQRACIGCHEKQGEGGLGPQLNNHVLLSSASDGFLYDTIAHGRVDTAMRGFLRGHGKKDARTRGSAGGGLVELDEHQIDSIVAFMRSWSNKTRTKDLKRKHALAGNPLVGKDIWENIGSCNKCHGDQGEGTSGPSLSNAAFLKASTDGFLIGTTILGRTGSEMLSFHRGGNVKLTDQQVLDVVSYIRQWEHRPPSKRLFRRVELTTPAVAAGRVHYDQYCVSCHGPNGRDGFAPALNNPEFLEAANDGFLQATIARGRSHTPMRAFGRGTGGIAELDGKTINEIVAFIRSWQKGAEVLPEKKDEKKTEEKAPSASAASAREKEVVRRSGRPRKDGQ